MFDRGPTLEGARGVDAIASFTLKPEHEEAIQGGLAHFVGLPLIDLHGDEAIVTSYLQVIQLDHQATPTRSTEPWIVIWLPHPSRGGEPLAFG